MALFAFDPRLRTMKFNGCEQDAQAFKAESRAASHTDVARVAVKLGMLNADELEAGEMLLDKLLAGKAKHGPLDLNGDTRDWMSEVGGEALDIAFYVVFALIQRRRGL